MTKRSPIKKINFATMIEGVAKRMQLEFDLIFSQLPYDLEKGKQCEKALIRVLQDYLPPKVGVGHGHIVAMRSLRDEISWECDVVIYDKFECPLLFKTDEYQIFPSDYVHAIIEVKSTLNLESIKKSFENIKEFKRIVRYGKTTDKLGVIFAYKSVYSGREPHFTLKRKLEQEAKKYQEDELADLIFVLDFADKQRWVKSNQTTYDQESGEDNSSLRKSKRSLNQEQSRLSIVFEYNSGKAFSPSLTLNYPGLFLFMLYLTKKLNLVSPFEYFPRGDSLMSVIDWIDYEDNK